ncbi:uncharacterized protein CC84DRAFT_879235 [Paraphaeosphaeria sporulosa]|uniref:Uncharacterized protein n=1 Tax=Paraphaeosphaeria sporulosa TaxID=1460663 RepID=A0A177CAZ8_9PLEO|nr:uncharacterized protein CC84DRAFT_879235 [Paraphaeosphaeria sporulosa]OAG04019.1 hypothetical protein CC84DRAFT_879235 [Paraphaeosphaeria sporulosa]
MSRKGLIPQARMASFLPPIQEHYSHARPFSAPGPSFLFHPMPSPLTPNSLSDRVCTSPETRSMVTCSQPRPSFLFGSMHSRCRTHPSSLTTPMPVPHLQYLTPSYLTTQSGRSVLAFTVQDFSPSSVRLTCLHRSLLTFRPRTPITVFPLGRKATTQLRCS